jgi:hypothetical protein
MRDIVKLVGEGAVSGDGAARNGSPAGGAVAAGGNGSPAGGTGVAHGNDSASSARVA